MRSNAGLANRRGTSTCASLGLALALAEALQLAVLHFTICGSIKVASSFWSYIV